MKQLLALLLFVPSLCLAQSVTLPYNPDANADSAIGAPDLLEMLPLFGGYFTPDPILIDGMEINEYLNMLEENGSSTLIEGSEHGQMLYWNGGQWTLLPAGSAGEFLGTDGAVPAWQQLPLEGTMLEVGCSDQTACNYDPDATVNYAALCVYEDECDVCDGPGAIYECGCADLPEGDCDCDGNQLDALNVCGGTCEADADVDGICDDGDDCIGEADECGVCNGPGAIYECGCTGIAPDECDCAGTPDVDLDGICDTEDPCIGVADSDGDGICDDVDDCDGTLDLCGVCNGPGPVYECGCSDIPEGDCDCAGNQFDESGNCADYLLDSDGDGIYDEVSDPCLNQTHHSFNGSSYALVEMNNRCWFAQNLSTNSYQDGTTIEQIQDESAWNALDETGAFCTYGADNIYGYLYNGYAAARNVCPQYWELPTHDEWLDLIDSLGGPEPAGGALKQSGTSLWLAPNDGATNATGFSALPGGQRALSPDDFYGLSTMAAFWAKPDYNAAIDATPNTATALSLEHTSPFITDYTHSIRRGHSIRCLRSSPVLGCTDIHYLEFNPAANVNDGSCEEEAILGCTDSNFVEYAPQANSDDGSCLQMIGCTDNSTIDHSGYSYQLTTIGSQCWFRENLRTTSYLNGDPIQNLQDGSEWASSTYGAWVDYNNNPSNGEVYGKLYNWYAVEDARGLCPNGWHVPTDEDFKSLESHLGLTASEIDSYGWRGQNEGIRHQLKASSDDDPGWNGLNTSDFTALKGNCRYGDSNFTNVGNPGSFFWTSTSSGGGNALMREIDFGVFRGYPSTSGLVIYGPPLNAGFSVRCIRD